MKTEILYTSHSQPQNIGKVYRKYSIYQNIAY